MDEDNISDCITALGCRREGFPQTYLGLPLSNTKLRLSAFAPNIAKCDRYLPPGGLAIGAAESDGRIQCLIVN